MNWYRAIRPVLFSLDAETAHGLAFHLLNSAERLGVLQHLLKPYITDPVTIAGIRFPNPVGLAAGLDKNGDYLKALARLGFGFIEIGTITPRPQPGNPKPRLFRLPEHQAIINRMGFNNKGVDHLITQVKQANFNGVLGINIGKNFDTPVENAVDDYLLCLEKVYPYASYITVNISSPNTPGLRELQYGKALSELLQPLKQRQTELSKMHSYKPIFVKIAPDMSAEELTTVAHTLLECEIDGVIASNTTLSRDQIAGEDLAEESGGLSGKPLNNLATQMVAMLSETLQGKLPIIGVGGICNGEDTLAKIDAGASLVQIYTGFIYQGPKLIAECVQSIKQDSEHD